MTQAEERSAGTAGTPTVSRFHTRLKQRPAEAFLAVRAVAISLGPDVKEDVTEGSVSYLRRQRPFLTVHAEKTRLHLAFPRDLPIDDPNGRLLRRGDQRYLAVDGAEAVDGHVQEFMRKAYAAMR